MTTGTDGPQDKASILGGFLAQAKSGEMTLPDLFRIAEGLSELGLLRESADLYAAWTAYNGDHQLRHLALFNQSIAFRKIGDLPSAINALRDAARLAPSFGPAHINLGRALEDAGVIGQAVKQWHDFAASLPDITAEKTAHKLMVLQHMGRVLENTKRLDAAEDALRMAMELRPDKPEAAQHWIALRQRQCEWPVLAHSDHISRRQLLTAMSPMALAAYADDPMFQLARAWHYNRNTIGRPQTNLSDPPRVRRRIGAGERLKIGYLSSDLREHAVGFALSEVLELHDKSQCEIHAYYCGEIRPADPVQQRIIAAVDHWCDINPLSDLEAAQRIADDEIDILIDVNGYTKNARTLIVAHRPAPVIVNFCGYPGTMGSPYHHYLIADAEIIPPENEIYFSEKVLRIPCNQPIDRKRPYSDRRPSRAEAGLPEEAFVFASFNGMQKITPACFARWMEILSHVPNSVLWLLTGSEDANECLRAAAESAGIERSRLIFAPKAPNAEHLARIALADLFLDTLPYGAHSTAADAVTMGLPILTLRGRGFAARFCASVVRAAGIGELICTNAEDYVTRAVQFARDPASLRPYRERLANCRNESTLGDVPALVRSLEKLFWQMQADAERGQLPRPDLTNLDVYFEIGLDLEIEKMESLDEADYRSLYRDRLAQWNAFCPLPEDTRLWPGQKHVRPLRKIA